MIRSTTYSTEKAHSAVAFIESLKHTKGQYRGVQFLLADWQREWTEKLFGTLTPDGRRQYRKAFLAVPKKSGKTALASGVGIKLLCADGEEGAEVYSAAASRDQATLVYREMRDMIKQIPRLKKRTRWYDSVKRIVYTTASGAENTYQALSADADYSDGINPSGVIVDELHRHKNRELYDLLNEGGGTRRQPLTIVITTAGSDKSSVCYEEWEYARKVLTGVIDDPTFLPVIYEMPEGADWQDEAEWFKCNPALGDFLDIEDLRKSVREASEKPGKQNSVRRLRFNQWTSADSRWFDLGAWDACGGMIDETKLYGRIAFGGVDLSSTEDFTAWQLVIPWEGSEGYDILTRAWIPRATLEKRTKQRAWLEGLEREGFLTVIPGDSIDPEYIENQILKDAERFEIREIGYDPWLAKHMAIKLEAQGLTCVPVRQGYGTLSAPSKLLERLVRDHKLNHGGHPLLRWMADVVMVETDANENIKPSKKASNDRIDCIAATVTALERAMHQEEQAAVSFVAFD